MIREDLKGVHLAIISSKRAPNVPKMTELVGHATWYTNVGEQDAYHDHGAMKVVETAGSGISNLVQSRNRALKDAWDAGVDCLMLDDDCKKFDEAIELGGKMVGQKLEFREVVRRLREALRVTGAYLAGAHPSPNPFFFSPNRPITTAGFIAAAMMYVKPCDLWFDPGLIIKEDYDYVLQHLKKFGKVARVNSIMAHFRYGTGKGGVVDYRNDERMQEANEYLKTKWPGYIRDNPRRQNEILLKLK